MLELHHENRTQKNKPKQHYIYIFSRNGVIDSIRATNGYAV
jgi:hypothetical protein